MRYKIPRYIDYEAKIFGPASFKQFMSMFVGLIVVGIFWLIIDNFFLFVLVALIIFAIFGGFSFGTINGLPLPTMISKYISFSLSGSKTYFWEKKEFSVQKITKKEPEPKTDIKKELPTTYKRGNLDKMSKDIETS